jgi:tetratricopeptide (TPR) repeat protein
VARKAQEAWDAEDWPRAARLLEDLLAQDPDDRRAPGRWYDAALAYKFMRDWPKAYELGKEAAARAPRGQEDPAFWNLGIAATIRGDWATARDAWAGYGIDLPPGDGEIDEDLGVTCVRLDPEGEVEIVWARRICPARARVLSVPFNTARRYGVLYDDEPPAS